MKDKILKIKILFTRYFYYLDINAWKKEVWDSDLDENVCCSGEMCCCNGETYRQNYLH